MEEASSIFEGTDIQITTQGQRHLGAAIGTFSFAACGTQGGEEDSRNHCSCRNRPHPPSSSVYCICYGMIGRWQYVMRTTDNTSALFQPLEDAIHQHFIPALTVRAPCSADERKLLSLPARYGGLNIVDPVDTADRELTASRKISGPLTEMIANQTDLPQHCVCGVPLLTMQ